MRTNPTLPALFIGVTEIPISFGRKGAETWHEYAARLEEIKLSDPRVTFIARHQTAGVACYHQDLFGCFFEISQDLLQFCEDTCEMAPPTYERAKEYDLLLRPHHLHLSGIGYELIQEGLISGIDPDALFAYIRENNLKMWSTDHTSWVTNSFASLDQIVQSVNKSHDTASGGEVRFPPLWEMTGAIVYENCD